jgi:hypothetical protein
MVQCRKPGAYKQTDTPGLPPATQIGANTFGFLLNGQPWVPEGNDGGGNNLSISFDPGFNNGVFGIAVYRATATMSFTQGFGIGIRDSLNYFSFPKTFILSHTSLFRARGNKEELCTIFSKDIGTFCNGQLSVDKLDRQNGIIAGRFNFTLHENGCDTIKVTSGRFDMKF